ncbi:MAG TPA: hypothetical protein VMM13_10220 [Euzebya sp.]|nr:hypothetical protein [Euzebya sp.]
MQPRSSVAHSQTNLRSADNTKGWIDAADVALQCSSSMLRHARDLVVQSQNGSIGQIGREAIAYEIESLRAGLIDIANTRHAGRHLFAGRADSVGAFDADGTYLGDAETVNQTVADGQQVQVNVIGCDAFGDGPDSIFAVLDTIAGHLRTDPGAVGANLTVLDAGTDRILTALDSIGARSDPTDGSHDRSPAHTTTLQGHLSEVESSDLTETIMELQMQEVAYQFALAATARVIQPSLLDFLR